MAVVSNAGGKGSGKRPSQVSKEQFANNWDTIFSKKKETKPTKQDSKEKK